MITRIISGSSQSVRMNFLLSLSFQKQNTKPLSFFSSLSNIFSSNREIMIARTKGIHIRRSCIISLQILIYCSIQSSALQRTAFFISCAMAELIISRRITIPARMTKSTVDRPCHSGTYPVHISHASFWSIFCASTETQHA